MRTNIAMDKSKATMNRLTQQLAKKRRVKALATSIFNLSKNEQRIDSWFLDSFILYYSGNNIQILNIYTLYTPKKSCQVYKISEIFKKACDHQIKAYLSMLRDKFYR